MKMIICIVYIIYLCSLNVNCIETKKEFNITKANSYSSINTLPINIYALSKSQNRIADAYKKTLHNIMDSFSEDIQNYDSMKEKLKDEDKSKMNEVLIKCKNSLKDIEDESLYTMFIATGFERNDDFGDYDLCKSLGDDTRFVLVKEIKPDLTERLQFGACIPTGCTSFFEELDNHDVSMFDKNYILTIFPQNNQHTIGTDYFIIIVIIYVGLVILANILMRILFSHYNPYDQKEVKLHSKSIP